MRRVASIVVVVALGAVVAPGRSARAEARSAGGDALVDALDEALAPLALDAPRAKPVVVDEVPRPRPWLTLHETHPEVARDAILQALARRGYHGITGSDGASDPAVALAAHRDAAGAVLFRLDSDWGAPRLELSLRTRSGTASTATLAPPNTGLVTLSSWRIALLAALLAAPLAWVMTRRRRTRPSTAYRPDILRRDAPRKHDDGIALSDGALALLAPPDAQASATVVTPPRATSAPDAASLRGVEAPGLAEHLAALIPLHGSTATPARIRDRYRIVSELGRGAMGIVYRAHDETLDREVALKAIGDEMRAHPEGLLLFASEAKALAQLNHPNIVAIYDQLDDMLVMELVDGTTVDRELARRTRYPWRDALAVIDQLCAGLAYAHGRGVIHRDIKPANIFIATSGTVKLGDFGLARLHRAPRSTVQIRGTPSYMAPEQITGAAIDHRADLYAVGGTLFELLAGRPAFIDGDLLYRQVQDQPPHVRELVPDVPVAVDALVSALLAKAPAGRPPHADAVRAAIAELLTTGATG